MTSLIDRLKNFASKPSSVQKFDKLLLLNVTNWYYYLYSVFTPLTKDCFYAGVKLVLYKCTYYFVIMVAVVAVVAIVTVNGDASSDWCGC